MLQEYKRKKSASVTAVQLKIDRETFEGTYRMVSPGVYEKGTPVWAEEADKPGTIRTKEGSTDYKAGDYLVSNDRQGKDSYAVSRKKFHSLYELTEN